MTRNLTWLLTCGTAAVALTAGPAAAGLQPSYTFVGKGNWSLGGVGGSNNPTVGSITIIVPAGSVVVKAFLYSSTNFKDVGPFTPSITLGATNYSGGQFIPLGVLNSGVDVRLQAFRADVTAQVAGVVNGGPGGNYTFPVGEDPARNDAIDGEVLAVVYSNPNEVQRSIIFLDGSTAPAGTTTVVNYASPLPNPATPGFEALVSLGIGFSFQGTNQFSTVDVNGRRLTSSAGGQDDGDDTGEGSLITVGGVGDSPTNPANPFAGPNGNPRLDDELYNLALGNTANPTPFLAAGQTTTTLFITNPSNDDNIFFVGLNLTAVASVGPTQVAPEPATVVLGLIGASVAGLGVRCRRPRVAG